MNGELFSLQSQIFTLKMQIAHNEGDVKEKKKENQRAWKESGKLT